MREHRRDRGRLEDIREYAHNVEKIIEGITFEDFVDDIRIYYSVMKQVEIIGEAANMLTRHFRETHNELTWRQIVSMMNILVHGYAQVSDKDLWDTATGDISPMCEQVERYLADIDWEAWAQNKDFASESDDNAVYDKILRSARKMKAKGYSADDIVEITGLTLEEINNL